MHHVKVMIFLDASLTVVNLINIVHRPLMDILHKVKGPLAQQLYTLGQKVVLQTPSKIEFLIKVLSHN
jgi:hypothetical protein